MRFIFSARGSRAVSCALLASAAICCATAAQAAVTISDKPTSNMNCTGGVCSPTAKKANLNVTDLANMLAAGDAKVVSDSGAKDIELKAPLSWTSTSRLTLDSYRSIAFQQPVTVAGTGALTITTNEGGSKGDYLFEGKGTVEFWDLASGLSINGEAFRLVKNIHQLSDAVQNNVSGAYAFAADYHAAKDGAYNSSPVQGTFEGVFEGLGHTIFNLTIDDTAEGAPADALFANTKSSSVIRDVRLKGLSASSEIVSGLVGTNNGKVRHCAVAGSLTSARGAVGGIANANGGVLSDVSFSGQLAGAEAHMGGIVFSNYGMIDAASSSGSIVQSFKRPTADFDLGGLAAVNQGTISRSRSSVAISTNIENTDLGGLVGQNQGTISQSFASGAISNSSDFGGAQGGFAGENAGTITESFARGAVSSQVGRSGGFTGMNSQGTIADSYSTGAVAGQYAGGFVGDPGNVDTMSDSYWDTDTSGTLQACGYAGDCVGVTGLTTAKFKAKLPQGFDSKIWAEKSGVNDGYPFLLANPPPKK